ncbi:MAG: holo-[acyl-carrier-protein] synthase [Spirochaetes bacterium GWF1_49_6]|nr:MAG: holo-[acyl-carrier-protein] synthase [Spirochaetes bacterium GWF1_49_6]
MIIGVGIDIIEIERIQNVFAKRGEKFIKRVYTGDELKYCHTFSEQFTHLAARFSAKEAYYKAVGAGVLAFHEIEVYNLPTGKPEIRLHGKTREQWEGLGSPRIHVSLSHNRLMASAVVVLEREQPNGGNGT